MVLAQFQGFPPQQGTRTFVRGTTGGNEAAGPARLPVQFGSDDASYHAGAGAKPSCPRPLLRTTSANEFQLLAHATSISISWEPDLATPIRNTSGVQLVAGGPGEHCDVMSVVVAALSRLASPCGLSCEQSANYWRPRLHGRNEQAIQLEGKHSSRWRRYCHYHLLHLAVFGRARSESGCNLFAASCKAAKTISVRHVDMTAVRS